LQQGQLYSFAEVWKRVNTLENTYVLILTYKGLGSKTFFKYINKKKQSKEIRHKSKAKRINQVKGGQTGN